MSRYQVILFDLDGTLTDPAIGITNSVMYALKRFNIEVKDRTELYPFIGPPLKESFMKCYALSESDAERAVEYYREYFKDTGIFENTVIAGVEDMLSELKKAGKRIILATSKPIVFADRILEHFGLNKYFEFTVGSNLDGTLTDKAEVIDLALKKAGECDRSKIVMVGDRKHDIIGAVKNKVTPVGVLFGYGSREELEMAGAEFIVSSAAELKELLY